MLNRRLASALAAWWGAVLDRRAVLETVGAVVARLRCRGLLRALHSLRANVEQQGKKRVADAHYLHTKVRRAGYRCRLYISWPSIEVSGRFY